MQYVYDIDFASLKSLYNFEKRIEVQIVEETKEINGVYTVVLLRFVCDGVLLTPSCQKQDFSREFVRCLLGEHIGVHFNSICSNNIIDLNNMRRGMVINCGAYNYTVIAATDGGGYIHFTMLDDDYKIVGIQKSSIRDLIKTNFQDRVDNLTWTPRIEK